MRRLSAVAVVVAAVVLASVLTTAGGAQAPGERTLTFVAREGTEAFVDLPPRSRDERASAGDTFMFTQRVFDQAGTRRGSVYAKCVAVTPGRNPVFQCEGTYALADGTLALSAMTRGDDNPIVAVVGGTRAYEGARGSITTRELSRTSSEDTIHLLAP